MKNQTIWVVQSFSSEGSKYDKAFSNEEKAVKHYKEIVKESYNEFTKVNGEDFQFVDYEEFDELYCATLDSEKYSERIEITALTVY